MRYKIAEKNVGGCEESWFYVEYDAISDDACIVHRWENWYRNRPMVEQEIKLSLSEPGYRRYRSEALAVMRAMHPNWKGFAEQ